MCRYCWTCFPEVAFAFEIDVGMIILHYKGRFQLIFGNKKQSIKCDKVIK